MNKLINFILKIFTKEKPDYAYNLVLHWHLLELNYAFAKALSYHAYNYSSKLNLNNKTRKIRSTLKSRSKFVTRRHTPVVTNKRSITKSYTGRAVS